MTVPSATLRLVAAALCVVVAAVMALAWRGEHRLSRAGEALEQGDARRALTLAQDSAGATRDERAARTASVARLRLGDLAGAERDLAGAVRDSPEDWSLRYDHAVLLLRQDRRAEAAAEMRRALALNPRADLPTGFTRDR